jgi:SAM-dependent methyltransferase
VSTWHYGLVARWWAEFNQDGPEIEYFKPFVEHGQPALDVGCGTGRLLLPWLRAGLDVDGCDVSADMIALCRERAEQEGLSPTLLVQPMHELDPPRRYRTIVVCGAFGLGSTREQDVQALDRFYEHLEPGGTLLLDNEVPYANPRRWPQWVDGERQKLPEPWGPPGERRRASDGSELGLRSRALAIDPLNQVMTLEINAEEWRDGRLAVEEKHTITLHLYFRDELLLMLERAGFTDVDVRGGYADEEPSSDHEFLVFRGTKPAQAS